LTLRSSGEIRDKNSLAFIFEAFLNEKVLTHVNKRTENDNYESEEHGHTGF
jgi:hypothetical protein